MNLAVKRVGPDTIEGLAIPFVAARRSGKDLVGERFTKSTDLCIDWFGRSGRPLLYDHGLDGAHKAQKIGRQDDFEERAEGIWAQSQLDLNAKYRKAVDQLIEEEALGYSSGAMPHLATKNARTGDLTRWPWVELSLTPIPAEPLTLGVHYTKSAHDALDLLVDAGVDVPEPLMAAMKALDDWAAIREPEPTDAVDDLLVVVDAFGSIKAGRTLSSANRDRLVELRSRVAAASEHAAGVLTDLDDLLASTDPDASKALWSAVFEALTTEVRWNGVDA